MVELNTKNGYYYGLLQVYLDDIRNVTYKELTNWQCFAPIRWKLPKLWVFGPPEKHGWTITTDYAIEYVDDVLKMFPNVIRHPTTPELFVVEFERYTWHPAEFLLMATLLRNCWEYAYYVYPYKIFKSWGASPSQAIYLSHFYWPQDFNVTIDKMKFNPSTRTRNGHTLIGNSYSYPILDLSDFDIPSQTNKLRKTRMKFINSNPFSMESNYIKHGKVSSTGPWDVGTKLNENDVKEMIQGKYQPKEENNVKETYTL